MQIVNGYVCMNCCDVDKARLGEDPHQSTDQLQKQLDRHIDKFTPADFGPPVTFGGSLQATTAAGTAAGTSPNTQNADANIATTVVNLIA
jgi:hypothetical protein